MSTWIATTQERPLLFGSRGCRDLRGERLIETRSAEIAGIPCGSVDAAFEQGTHLVAAGKRAGEERILKSAGKQRGYLPARSNAALRTWSCFVGRCIVGNQVVANQVVANQNRDGTAGREVRGM